MKTYKKILTDSILIEGSKKNKYQKYFERDMKQCLAQFKQFSNILSASFYVDLEKIFSDIVDAVSDEILADKYLSDFDPTTKIFFKFINDNKIGLHGKYYEELNRLQSFFISWDSNHIQKSWNKYIITTLIKNK